MTGRKGNEVRTRQQTVEATYSRSNGKGHQVRVQARLCLDNVREVVPAVWPIPQTHVKKVLGEKERQPYLNSHASDPQTDLSKLNASIGM